MKFFNSSFRDHRASQSVQHAFFGRLDIAGMDIERSPVVNDTVVRRCHCDDAHLRIVAEQLVTDGWPSTRLVERNDHEMGQGLLHTLRNLGLIRDLTDNFYVWLISKSCKDNLPHEPGMVRHEDPNRFFQGTLRAP